MELPEFLELLNGHLLWYERDLDARFNQLAWYSANIMLSSGNMKKGTNPVELKKGLYESVEDLQETQAPKETKRKKAEEEKEKLLKRFDLQN
ncbi:hypothetical protein [Rummeliibacillus stabekisii]|uniref:hypothetical protein n=1 Tax=Rummeliibacillus stabekisii TaxID=241244 RepID=UPI0037190846